ncbi:MAG TPA: S8 family serine peptidase, partial [Solirubrobacterales bacterium]|nr:S8 family serine peptidase [Solirubrobacterales bacterium]
APQLPVRNSAPVTQPVAFSPDRVIVEWAAGASPTERRAAREEADVDFTRDLGSRRFQLVETEPGQTPREAVRELEADPGVVLAERDGYLGLDSIPNDPLFDQLWGLQNTGLGIDGFEGAVAGDDIDASGAWDRTVGTPNTVVADIDTGYRFEHPDLANVAWINPGETLNGLDDDGDGIVDDVHGADFVGANAEVPVVDGDPTDDDLVEGGHGVHTAGTIGAEGNNGIGITGVAQDVSIMPLRVCSHELCPGSAVVAAIGYAGAHGARVANISLGSESERPTIRDAIAATPQTLFVVAGGNQHQNNEVKPHYPCDYNPLAEGRGPVDNVICVAATDQADQLAEFSNWGAKTVDLGAPGTETLSTYPITYLFHDGFEVDDFATKWTPTGPDGGFARTNEPPLTSYGIGDSPGAPPAPGSIRASRSAPVTIPPGFQECVVEVTRKVSGGPVAWLDVELDGETELGFANNTSGRISHRLLRDLSGGGQLTMHVEYTAAANPQPGDGAWFDDIDLYCISQVGEPGGYAFLEGTSMATPHVTGAAALLFSMKPTASVVEVRQALLGSVDPVFSLAGKTTSGGRLDVGAATDLFDSVPPPDPVLSATNPPSPAKGSQPKVIGSAQPGTSVDVYANADCSGSPVASGSATQLAGSGIAVTVGVDTTTQFSVTATDLAPHTSACSAPISYTENSDLVAPSPPQLIGTDPASPGVSGAPRILGAAEAGSAVHVYTGLACAGSPVATGSAAGLGSPGIPVQVAEGVTAVFSATATDSSANTSACSAPISYTRLKVTTNGGGGDGGPNPACVVPKLAGKTLARAKAALTTAACKLGTVRKPRPRKGKPPRPLVVKSSTPVAGARPADGKVNLTLGPKPRKAHR